MNKKILFIGGTHGDETIGVEVLEKMRGERNDFDVVIGNPKALRKGRRFVRYDLNRCAPGSRLSPYYEKRRARFLVNLSKKYDYTIDIHGSSCLVGIFTIITNPSPENLALADKLDLERIVIWPAFSPELKGALSEYFNCGVELECGPKEDEATKKELSRVLLKFLDSAADVNYQTAKPKKYYQVYGSLSASDEINYPRDWEEFCSLTWRGETFVPLLINSYKKRNGIYCYKMKQIEK